MCLDILLDLEIPRVQIFPAAFCRCLCISPLVRFRVSRSSTGRTNPHSSVLPEGVVPPHGALLSRDTLFSCFLFSQALPPATFPFPFPHSNELQIVQPVPLCPFSLRLLSAIIPSHHEFDFKYNWIDGAENLEKYAQGGYHAIMIGDTLQEIYRIVDKLGFGGYSTAWLGRDLRLEQYVAVKVGIADGPDRDSRRELKARPASSYTYPSQQYLNSVLVKLGQLSTKRPYEKYGEPETVAITQRNKDPLTPNAPPKAALPLDLGKGAEEFTLSEVGGLLLNDIGEAFEPASDLRQGKDCHTLLAFRAPEAPFEPEAPLSYPSDIWGLATAIWEILGMKAIFSLEYTDIKKIISQHIDVLGPLPLPWWGSWEERDLFFDGNGKHKKGRGVAPPINEAFEEGVQKYRRMAKIGEFDKEEASAILSLMCRMLGFRLEDRPTAEQVLNSEWMMRWALPDFQRSCRHSSSALYGYDVCILDSRG
ncbi:unnamed protein product [Penicillium egyptiacum]|uniref:non-specific serine/threonine protein kinase n=1 Tax=Penicillium egyptiacum TaxID=1303716 RepID=A0A9W4KNV3_9EURO|nr:unnamed protein product [Penicillium egyptiacum]